MLAGGIVHLAVGKEEVPYDAHIELLCSKSQFFDRALNGNNYTFTHNCPSAEHHTIGRFVEADTKYIPLPDDCPDAFADLLSWVYSGNVSLEARLPPSPDGPPPTWFDLCKLWILADKYEVRFLPDSASQYHDVMLT